MSARPIRDGDEVPKKAPHLSIGKKEINEFLPKTGFLRKYYDAALPLTDSPAIFHVAAAYSVASAMATGVHLPFGMVEMRPNLWMLILAPTSYHRKSTSLTFANQILTFIDPTLVFPNEFSGEAFIKLLAERPEGSGGAFVWSEFGGVLAQMTKKYMVGTHQMLADLYDCPQTYRRRLQKEDVFITRPYFSILGASSLVWFAEHASSPEMVHGGFLTRFMFIIGQDKEDWQALPPKLHQTTVHELGGLLQYLRAETRGEMSLDPEATKFYTDWARQKEEGLERQERLGVKGVSLFRRSLSHALKIAMVNAWNDNRIVISFDDVAKATIFVDRLFDATHQALYEELIPDRTMRNVVLAKRLILERGFMFRTDLMRRMHMPSRMVDEVILILKDQEFIIESTKKWKITGGVERQARVYYVNDEYGDRPPDDEIEPVDLSANGLVPDAAI